MKVRDANEADLKALYEFEEEIIYTERRFYSTLQDEDFHYYDFKDLIISQDVKIVVAEVDNEVVGSGFAQMKKAENYLKHAAYAYVGQLYVKPLHRGKELTAWYCKRLTTGSVCAESPKSDSLSMKQMRLPELSIKRLDLFRMF